MRDLGDRMSRGRRSRAFWLLTASIVLCGALAAAALAASTNFIEPASSPEALGAQPTGVAAADFDGDGDLDLALSLWSSNKVAILKNNGSANFNQPATSPEAVGTNPRSVIAADLDGDGDQDLAVANKDTNNVTVLKNTGSGNFTQPPSSPVAVGSEPFSLIASDLDGDADQDLAVANSSSDNVTILKNSGSATFSQPASSPEAVGNNPLWIVVANVDGDADQDLATANNADGNLTILKNNGSGNFIQPATSPEAVGASPVAIAAADLDGDSDRDLAVVNHGDDTVTILKNTGAGNFNQPASSPETTGDGPWAVAASDFDADGDQDLAVPNSLSCIGEVTILRNTGVGNFVEPGSSPEAAGCSPDSVAAVDLDGDADPDLAVANGPSSNVTILKNH